MTDDASGHVVIVVSDATGATAEHAVNAALAQFEKAAAVKIEKRSRVRSVRAIREVIGEAHDCGAMVVHTLASTYLRRQMVLVAREQDVQVVDLFGNLLAGLTSFLKNRPEGKPGGLQRVDETYYKRLDAITFAVKHDDGLMLDDLRHADIVLVGVSRTSKTPLSIYLAARGYLVANVPIVPGIEPPVELFSVDQRKVVGLRMDPARLKSVRESRLKRYRREVRKIYIDPRSVENEIRFGDALFKQQAWPAVDVTMKSLEEAAAEVVSLAGLPRFRASDSLR